MHKLVVGKTTRYLLIIYIILNLEKNNYDNLQYYIVFITSYATVILVKSQFKPNAFNKDLGQQDIYIYIYHFKNTTGTSFYDFKFQSQTASSTSHHS